jgi:LysM repeat protein
MRSLRVAAGRWVLTLAIVLVLLPGVAEAGGATHVVQAGETLSLIARAHGTSVAAIVQANGLRNPDVIYVGQRLIIPTGGAAGSAGAGGSRPQAATRFVVSISQQHCWLVQNGSITGSWPCSTGRRGAPTVLGVYAIQSKMPVAYGSRWDFNMPYWLGIYNAGATENGIHGLPYNRYGKVWANKIGTPISFGCVVLQDAAARRLYSVAYIGMQVVVRW